MKENYELCTPCLCWSTLYIFPCLQKRNKQGKTRRLLRITSISFASSDGQIRVHCSLSLNRKAVADLWGCPTFPMVQIFSISLDILMGKYRFVAHVSECTAGVNRTRSVTSVTPEFAIGLREYSLCKGFRPVTNRNDLFVPYSAPFMIETDSV